MSRSPSLPPRERFLSESDELNQSLPNSDLSLSPADRIRRRIEIQGIVQGVGFRPFVYRLAGELRLGGWIRNDPTGVIVEIEGTENSLDEFLRRLYAEAPPHAEIASLQTSSLPITGASLFEIRRSEAEGDPLAYILPDLASCPDCVSDIFDSKNRRYRYPFTNCTRCGPRYSIILHLPYDRPNTTMADFELCDECRREYGDPGDRRFHAQPTACPACGPQLTLGDGGGRTLAERDEALRLAGTLLREGTIIALKGLGGFQLLTPAGSSDAVSTLRRRKRRSAKPFAVMFPSMEALRSDCIASESEVKLIESVESPIVLIRRRETGSISGEVAPGNPDVGAMLPYTPLHHLLLRDVAQPLVATSGNLSDEPICSDNDEALRRLAGIADYFLIHNRGIARPVDDSVARSLLDRPQIIRRARGYAPAMIAVEGSARSVIAFGGHLKNSVALSTPAGVVVSQHIGDLDNRPALEAFEAVQRDLQEILRVNPIRAIADEHPDYASTRRAEESGLPLVQVQHHLAHVLSCAAENRLAPPYLGVAWDGTGFGSDGTIWGGEFFDVQTGRIQHIGGLRTFPLPGGDTAAREPFRCAVGLLWESFHGDLPFEQIERLTGRKRSEAESLARILRSGIGVSRASSVGRLFDAVASLCSVSQRSSFEGEAAMAFEFAGRDIHPDCGYRFHWIENPAEEMNYPLIRCNDSMRQAVSSSPLRRLDWEPAIKELLDDLGGGAPVGVISARFHLGLAHSIAEAARWAGAKDILLSGGCFLNRLLSEQAASLLEAQGSRIWFNRQVPPGDGGISLGQIAAAQWIS